MTEIIIHNGDNRLILKEFPTASFDSCVCDPPYELGFMGKSWDKTGIAYDVAMWREVYRVLKPGAHLLAFGGSRTYHRLACAIEDAGFEIRDQIQWLYGSGFPKSLDVSKAIDKAAGAEREVVGKRTDGRYASLGCDIRGGNFVGGTSGTKEIGIITAPATDLALQWEGWGTALKPAHEPIVVARKPLEGTVVNNVLKHGCGGINVAGCRIEGPEPHHNYGRTSGEKSFCGEGPVSITPQDGRWPANVIHDGSDEVLACFPETSSGARNGSSSADENRIFKLHGGACEGSKGSASRFFKTCAYSELELLFHRAKAIIEAWNPDLANIAERDLSLSSQVAVSVLRNAVTAVSLGDKLLNDVKGLSTTVTQTESNLLCETLIMAILSLGNGYSPGLWQGELSPNGCLVKFAEIPEQTGTMTITISHWKSNGIADAATFSIMPQSMAVGEKGLKNGSRFAYCAKASQEERNRGLETRKGSQRDESRKKGNPGGDNPRNRGVKPVKNNHPTVKPLALMCYLVRLVTPPGGVVLDHFMGSGSTLIAAAKEGFDAVGIDLEMENCQITERRCRGHLGMLAEVKSGFGS